MSESEDKARIQELEAQLKAQGEQLAKLSRMIDPPPRPHEPARLEGHSASTLRLLDQLSLPKQVFDDFVAAVPDEVCRQLRTDGKK